MSIPTHSDVDDVNIIEESTLMSPAYIIEQLALGEKEEKFIKESRNTTKGILQGNFNRLLVVLGPCSIHDIESAKTYADLIAEAREKHSADLEIIMRAYFEKPRTTTGWEGFIADPKLDGSYDMNHGLFQARKLLLHMAARGVPSATEFVSLTTPQYIADLVAYGAIGARTAESQDHRKLTSGLSMPTGIKNSTDGNVRIAIDGVISARHSHKFPSITKHGTHALFTTKGNDGAHIIMRGGSDGTNYDRDSLEQARILLEKAGLPQHLVVDLSHGNSRKDYNNQPGVNEDVCRQMRDGSNIIAGVMIEGHIKAGSQKVEKNIWVDSDLSITDSCVSWETTEAMLELLARAAQARRARK